MLMNNLKTFILLFIFAIFISACGEDTENTSDTDTDNDIENAEVAEDAKVICMWGAVSLKKTPEAKGKYVTAIYLGETAKYLGETVTDSTNKKRIRDFLKVELTDGTKGWVQANLMAVDAEPFAVKEKSKLYKRPDILSAGKDEFEKMQFVVVVETQDDWVKVRGKKRANQYLTTGWVKSNHLTGDKIDITVAILTERALSKGDNEKKLEALNEILENTDFSSSIFSGDVRSLVDELSTPAVEEAVEEEYEEYD